MKHNNEKINIRRGKLNQDEIDLVIDEIKKTANITGYTKNEWINFDTIFIAYWENNFAGVCVNLSINKQWDELAVLLVLPNFRGNGIGHLLFKTGLDAIFSQDKKAYITSRNKIVTAMMKQEKFDFIQLNELPLSIHFFNLKFILNFYRIEEFFRKKMYNSELPKFIFGIKR
jgi:GNAT superfamily N-acetyltransferase